MTGLFYFLPPFSVPAWLLEQLLYPGHLIEPIYSWVKSPQLKAEHLMWLPSISCHWSRPPLSLSLLPLFLHPRDPWAYNWIDRHVRASVLFQEEGVVSGSMKMLVSRCSFEGMKGEGWRRFLTSVCRLKYNFCLTQPCPSEEKQINNNNNKNLA